MRQLITKSQADQIISVLQRPDDARIYDGSTQAPLKFQLMTFSVTAGKLETAPFKVAFPFKGVYVVEASHPSVFVYLKPETESTYQSSIKLKPKDVLNFPFPIAGANIWWTGQSVTGVNGVSAWTITLCFIIEGEIKSGTVAQIEGVHTDQYDTYTQTRTTLGAATAGQVTFNSGGTGLGASILQNVTGADIWLGGSAVTNAGATRGILVQDGQTFTWNNKSDLYAYSVAGGDVITITEY